MSTDNLKSKEAREKLTGLVDQIKVAMMVTAIGQKPLSAVPMTTKKVNDDGSIWFLSPRDSEHNQNIAKDSEIQLLYSDTSGMEFVSVFGTAQIVTDRSVLEDLYSNTSDTWFNGVDDPNLTAIKFKPQNAYYWDTKENKYKTLYKLGIAALTGKEQDIGEKGRLDL